jgi:SlyX protein
VPEPNDTSTRLGELETRLAFQDDTIDQLNAVIRDQWTTIDRLVQQLAQLEDRVRELEVRVGPSPAAPPPHY